MTRPWCEIDWSAPRPDVDAIRRSRAALRFTETPLGDPATDSVISAVSQTHVNGGMLVGRFRAVDADEVVHWFMSRNRLDEYGFLDHLLNAPDVRQAVPELGLGRVDAVNAKFTQTFAGTLTLDGELAATLVRGGAYQKYSGRAAEAKRMTATFVEGLMGDRHEDCEVYRSTQAWCSWFFDVAWDMTWLIIDNRRMEVVLMCVTDTD